MQYVRSADGTQIAYEKAGEGPPLIITGGALGDHRFYRALAAELAKGFRVYNLDRRGRGQSGDTQPYAVEREVEDVAALIADAGSPVFVYGHSAGSALALRAAAAGLDVAKLVLADPPYSRHGDTEMLDSPGGEMMIDSARALPNEYALLGDGLVPNALAAQVAVPTLVMAAASGPKTGEALVEVMPNARLQLMPTSAHDLAAKDIASVVMPFYG
jgi:pimeloyl-ACP methyl ester carboxylesterase